MTHSIIKDLLSRHTTKKYDATKKIPEADLEVLFEPCVFLPRRLTHNRGGLWLLIRMTPKCA